MPTLIQPEHFGFYKQQADEMLDDLDGETLEVTLQNLIQEHCSAPTVAQHHIDAFINALPHYDCDPVLDAVYALQTLIRTRQAVANVMYSNNKELHELHESMFRELNSDPKSLNIHKNSNKLMLTGPWVDPSNQLRKDIQQRNQNHKTLYRNATSTTDEMSLTLSDQHDPIECFCTATRRLSILLIHACSGQRNPTQMTAIVRNDFQRIMPLFSFPPYNLDNLKSVALGLITDMNALPLPEDQESDDGSEE